MQDFASHCVSPQTVQFAHVKSELLFGAEPILLSNFKAAAGLTTDILIIAAQMKLEISILAGAFKAAYSALGQNES